MKKMFMLLLSVCAIKAVNAQTKFPVMIAIGNYSQLGYKKPDINFRGGIEYHSSGYWMDFIGKFNPTDKFSFGDINQYETRTSFFFKVPQGYFVGGGVIIRNIQFVDYGQKYWTIGPLVGGGRSFDNFRLLIFWNLPRYDKRYHFQGFSWEAVYDVKNRVRLGFEEGFFLFSPKIDHYQRHEAFVSSIICGVIF
jgi:hypothetical protein